MFLMVSAVAAGKSSAEIDDTLKGRILSVVEDILAQKKIQSGTLDLYDEEIKKVRNLRRMKKNDRIAEKEDAYFLVYDYRDIHAGDIVKVEFKVVDEEGSLAVENIRIMDVLKLANDQPQEDKEYSDAEIQDFMREYIGKQTKFTDGKLMLFDEGSQKLRSLEFKEIDEAVRRMGIFYNSTAKFTDADTGEVLAIDIAVEKRKGKLKIQALRIRDVKKGL